MKSSVGRQKAEAEKTICRVSLIANKIVKRRPGGPAFTGRSLICEIALFDMQIPFKIIRIACAENNKVAFAAVSPANVLLWYLLPCKLVPFDPSELFCS